ncbi:MAG: hypothetical protein ACXACP_08120 [Candidatus Hodarchaeales archaeon]|jgi:hypothetical protein
MDDVPSKPNRRKLTLGDFTTIIMTQINSPDQSFKTPRVNQSKQPDCK